MAASIRRITEMEGILDECTQAVGDLSRQLEKMDAMREKMIRLFRYYGSEDWYQDRESPLPENVKAGVLSEDLVYDAITDLRDEAFRMLELATDILKNRI